MDDANKLDTRVITPVLQGLKSSFSVPPALTKETEVPVRTVRQKHQSWTEGVRGLSWMSRTTVINRSVKNGRNLQQLRL